MKKTFCLLSLSLLATGAFAQEILVFRGTVKCYFDQDERATRGAQNVVVVPGFVPPKSGMTGPQGYYELNTAAQLSKLEGKYVMLYFISSCRSCEIKKNVFVSGDQVRQTTNRLAYLPVETIQLRTACKQAEIRPLQSDSIYNVVAKMQAQDLEKVSALNVITATPGVLNVLTNVITAAAVGGGTSGADTTTILPGKIRYGSFLFASAMNLSANTGFNFSPSRDLSEAAFWNPAALTASFQNSGIHLLANFKNNFKFSAYTRLTGKLMLGAGFLYTQQDEFRPTRFSNLLAPAPHLRTLKESAVYLSPAYLVSEKFSVGMAVKSIWQRYNRPDSVFVPNQTTNLFKDRLVNNQAFDVDVSFLFRPVRAFQVGVNLMNLAGTKLDADALPAQKQIIPVQQLRSLGIGLCYKWKQFHVGTDFLLTQNNLYDASIGLNYIPVNNVLVSGGYAFRQQSFSAGIRIKFFRLSYLSNNDLLLSEKHKGKAGILNGQLYSGFSFTF